MKSSFCLIIILLFSVASAKAQPETTGYWQQQVDYSIQVRLNDSANTAEGFEKITYHNHSPDSLTFLWVHLWPNAYKNDQTAFSEQSLNGGETAFYFSNEKEKGYINRLDFKIGQVSLAIEDHPQYIDIIKVLLPEKLAPGDSVIIQTPFHLKIPYRFSRFGYVDQHYSFAQWYPRIATYDKNGWHPMPYLNWGEYYNEFGNYTVDITLPSNYVIAATGELHNENEVTWLKAHTTTAKPTPVSKKKQAIGKKPVPTIGIPSSRENKTLRYSAKMVNDFAWFADKRYLVKFDTIQLKSTTVDAWNFVLPGNETKWSNSMDFTKNSIRFYSEALGQYPYPQVSVVCDPVDVLDGMEYPMITILNYGNELQKEFDITIAHEIGHNWFEAILATNEREYPWMDEGMNTFYEYKYTGKYYPQTPMPKGFIARKLPIDPYKTSLDYVTSNHLDQPISTSSEDFTFRNYNAIAYRKSGMWMQELEKKIGADKMSLLMQTFYNQWKFKHPQPEDFKVLATAIGTPLESEFQELNTTGFIPPMQKREIKLTGFFNLNETDKYQYIGIAPAIGYNNYDRFSIGLLVHNLNIPATRFRFLAAPMFATGSKQVVGYARASYDFYPKTHFQKIQLYANAGRFNFDDGNDKDGNKIFTAFSKVVPGIYIEFKKDKPVSTIRKWIDLKTYIIGEQQLKQELPPPPGDTAYYSLKGTTATTIVPQLSIGVRNERALYPWDATITVQQVKQLVRTSLTANYFLNFNEHHEGLSIRLFAGKIFYTKSKTDLVRSQNSRYHFTMYGPNGFQDYTYSNPFGDRNQSTSILGRQIMMRDGGFKYRSDYSAVQPGLKTNELDFFDNWLASLNFTIDIPRKINPLSVLPFKVPLKVFADVGTSASPWEANSDLPKFLYSAGLQITVLKAVTIYYPLIESKAFKEPNSLNDPMRQGGPAWWQKHLTFSIEVDKLFNTRFLSYFRN